MEEIEETGESCTYEDARHRHDELMSVIMDVGDSYSPEGNVHWKEDEGDEGKEESYVGYVPLEGSLCYVSSGVVDDLCIEPDDNVNEEKGRVWFPTRT